MPYFVVITVETYHFCSYGRLKSTRCEGSNSAEGEEVIGLILSDRNSRIRRDYCLKSVSNIILCLCYTMHVVRSGLLMVIASCQDNSTEQPGQRLANDRLTCARRLFLSAFLLPARSPL